MTHKRLKKLEEQDATTLADVDETGSYLLEAMISVFFL